jgi:tRNA G37 N-methylase TrmD
MRIDVFSIFPEYFAGVLDASLLGRARTDGLLDAAVAISGVRAGIVEPNVEQSVGAGPAEQ